MTDQVASLSQLCDDLRESCKVQAGDVVIVHSSARSVGPVEGGATMIAKAIQEVVTEQGTVLVPTFSHPPAEEDGVFDIRTTPSRVGFVTECFRNDPKSIRSQHPTHSVTAWGKGAKAFVADHEQTSGLGEGSPFHKAAQAGATILMIGCDLTACSLVHVAEAVMDAPYLGKVSYRSYDRPVTLVDYDGTRSEYLPVDLPGDSQGFRTLEAEMERRGLIEHCHLGKAKVLRFDAATCLEVAEELLKDDPAALLCDNPKCAVCPKSREVVAAYLADKNKR